MRRHLRPGDRVDIPQTKVGRTSFVSSTSSSARLSPAALDVADQRCAFFCPRAGGSSPRCWRRRPPRVPLREHWREDRHERLAVHRGAYLRPLFHARAGPPRGLGPVQVRVVAAFMKCRARRSTRARRPRAASGAPARAYRVVVRHDHVDLIPSLAPSASTRSPCGEECRGWRRLGGCAEAQQVGHRERSARPGPGDFRPVVR